MQYEPSARKLSQLDSLASTTVAAPAPISTQGCRAGARARANHRDMLSTCACHLGCFLGGLGRPLARMRWIAILTRTTPSTILTASAASDGAVAGLGGLSPVTRIVTVTTMARETSQPSTNAAPLRAPRSAGSTTRKAVSGNGSSATARPISISSRTTALPCLTEASGAPGTASRRPGAGNHHDVIEAQAPRVSVHLLQVRAGEISGH